MAAILDTHVHIYPVYDRRLAFESAITNARRIMSQAATQACPLILLLTERSSENFFQSLIADSLNEPAFGYKLEVLEEGLLLKIIREDGTLIYISAGRQFVSSEGLEVLALCSNRILEKAPFEDLIDQIISNGSIAVLPWSPGKWLFRRGAFLKEFFNKSDCDRVRIGDISMRPNFLWHSRLMKKALNRGCQLLAGSDPLPLSGEEKSIANYVMFSELSIEDSSPIASLKALLNDRNLRILGSRNSLFKAVTRWIRAQIKR